MLEKYSTDELKMELEKRKKEAFIPHTFCIEGTWNGYRSEQRRVCHREYVKDKGFAKAVETLSVVHFTDGTDLELSVRPMEYKEKKENEITSYRGLIRSCLANKTNSVWELLDAD